MTATTRNSNNNDSNNNNKQQQQQTTTMTTTTLQLCKTAMLPETTQNLMNSNAHFISPHRPPPPTGKKINLISLLVRAVPKKKVNSCCKHGEIKKRRRRSLRFNPTRQPSRANPTTQLHYYNHPPMPSCTNKMEYKMDPHFHSNRFFFSFSSLFFPFHSSSL